MLSPLVGLTSHHGTKQAAWYWHKCRDWSCFLLAEHLHAAATPASHPQHDDLAGFHASPLYSWWIAAADGFLSLKNPVRRAWWIAPDLVHPCAQLPSPPPPPPPRYARKGKTNSKMWTRSWFIKYRWSCAFLTLALKSLTVSICPSCVNTNMVGVKTFTKKKEKKISAHLVRPLSSLQWTLMTELRPLFSSAATSHSSEREKGVQREFDEQTAKSF